MKELLIGRQKEQKALMEYINSGRSEFIAVYGAEPLPIRLVSPLQAWKM